MRKYLFLEGEIFHVFNKSISNFGILNKPENCLRFIQALGHYNNLSLRINLGNFLKKNRDYSPDLLLDKDVANIKFISYCLMPDHYHLIVKIIKDKFLSKYISDVENSFTRFFNLKFNRKGPLWQSRFKTVKITSNEQLLHTTRYVHLNPTTSQLIDKPENWEFSSYRNIITTDMYLKKITEISIHNKNKYRKFVEDNKDYQQKFKKIKKLILE